MASIRYTLVLTTLSLLIAGGAARAGTISGEIKFQGEPKKRTAISMTADKFCAQAHPDKTFDDVYTHAANGNLVNALVFVSKGGPEKPALPTEKLAIDQQGCMYSPRVSAMMAGQEVEFLNGDKTSHNVAFKGKKNPAFNQMMAPGTKLDKKLEKPEMEIPLKCDVHPWMGGYIHVLTNPYFAVSDKDGKFTIKGLPAGEYELTVWYESNRYEAKEKTVKVTVGADDTKQADFTFAPKPKPAAE